MAQIRVKTRHHKSLLTDDVATNLYNHLRDSIEWEEGIRSKNGFTRLAKTLDNENKLVNDCIKEVIEKLQISVQLLGIYLNYYKDGSHYTPSHSHKGTKQIIVSLGATRTLTVGKTDYMMENGDVAIFGSSAHGVKREPLVTTGRISIALFVI